MDNTYRPRRVRQTLTIIPYSDTGNTIGSTVPMEGTQLPALGDGPLLGDIFQRGLKP